MNETETNYIERACREDGVCIISEGTLRREDTIPKMIDALRALHREAYDQLTTWPGFARHFQPEDGIYSEDAWTMLEEALNEAAPEGFYFGSHEGDGACLGFFPL